MTRICVFYNMILKRALTLLFQNQEYCLIFTEKCLNLRYIFKIFNFFCFRFEIHSQMLITDPVYLDKHCAWFAERASFEKMRIVAFR